ncbi:exopolysaccharide Pel transporter PelG [Maridesulfovibrio hydrothermalis]|uniref:Putative transmembrane protein n=1 Tax=Maridesulfovibrio hydrothermalis AM13 = DSM 14728 TaxID=1121451 RepID=L0RBH2_9BACT|nr:exopolysaccharide Pel transporter PelG [Maridesulfovibrio hydrothermalis]CCO24109.1 putative transmembrane protein [Maridesulfovibrio hydrothermalis AM13 = DSM 14728]
MAGIGFELRKMLRGDSYLAEMSAYLYAAMVSSGPWLMSVLCLAVLGLYSYSGFSQEDQDIFRTTIVYVYAFTLIYVGYIQLVVTRYLADKFYTGDEKITLTAFYTSAVIVLIAGAVIGVGGIWFFELTFTYKIIAVVLFLIVAMIWLAMIFLSAVKDFRSIVQAFAIGTSTSVGGAFLLYPMMGLEGYLLGYTAGQALIFFWLLARLLAEFPTGKVWDSSMLTYFLKYWELALIGMFFNLAIWVDKIMFWFAPDSRMVVPYLRTHNMYEGPIFFAYLTIVPTLAIFLVKIETRFYEHYHDYFAKIISKKELSSILQEKQGMIRMLRESLREILIVQGTVTLLCMFMASDFIDIVGLSPLQRPLLQIALVGSLMQVMLSVAVIILFYFDLRKEVLAVTLVFLFSNMGLTYLTMHLGFTFYGYGYCYSCLISLMFAYYLVSKSVKDLEYLTFSSQPLM